MNILHICSISNDKTSGISNVVPEHFLHQKEYANIGLLNCNKTKIEKLKNEKNVFYVEDIHSNIANLPRPFNNPDLVVFHGIYIPKYIKLSRYLKKKKIKYIIIPHGSLTENAQNIKHLKKKLGNLCMFNKFIYEAISVQYLSLNEKENSKAFKTKSFVSGNGIDIPNIKKQTFSDKGLKLIYVGRYAIYTKGLDILIELIKNNYRFMLDNSIILDLYGSNGDGKEKLKKSVLENNVFDVVKVNDAIFDLDKQKKLINHDIFIQLSRHEGQPLGIMEAMSLGIPVILSEGTSFGNIISDNNCGIMFKSEDEFIKKLKFLLKNRKELITMSNNAYDYSLKYLSWKTIAKKTIKTYEKIGG